MNDQEKWENEVRLVFKKIKSHKKPYKIKINKIDLIIFPNVFSPKYFTDSEWFAKTIPKIVKKKKLLEIGTGIGIVALFAALRGAEVVATDINPSAIKNTKENFKRYNLKIPVILSDMYKNLNSKEKFDFIFWNHPFNKGKNPKETLLLQGGFDYNYNGLKRYIEEAHKYLKKNGRLLLGTGNFADLKEIKRLASKYNYKMVLLKKIKMPLAVKSYLNNDYRIYELKIQK